MNTAMQGAVCSILLGFWIGHFLFSQAGVGP